MSNESEMATSPVEERVDSRIIEQMTEKQNEEGRELEELQEKYDALKAEFDEMRQEKYDTLKAELDEIREELLRNHVIHLSPSSEPENK